MKAFYISCVIFVFTLAIVITNYFYINNSADKLERLVTDIEENTINAKDSINELENFWNKNKYLFEYTINHNPINSVEIRIGAVKHYYNEGNILQLLRELVYLKEEIKELRRTERICLENIF